MAVTNRSKYSGLIFLSPALRDIKDSKYFIKKIGRFLGWIVPRVHLSLGLSSKDSNKFNCDEYLRNDPNF